MSDLLGSIWWMIVALGVLVTFHEFGHYWVARRCGVKVLRFWDGELPRTSTRKVKRKRVVEELQRLDRVSATAGRVKEKAQAASGTGGVADWLYPLVAEVCHRPVSDVRPEAQLLGDLGFDSLMLTEMSVALEGAGVPLPRE